MSLSRIMKSLFLVPFAFSSVSWAQDPGASRWLAAVQNATGKEIRVQFSDGKKMDGTLSRGSESELIVRKRGVETTVAQSDVLELQMRSGRSRGRKMLLGGIIGGAVGAGLATVGTVVARLSSEGGNDDKLVAIGVGVAAASAGIGTAIGAALPGHYQTIYKK